MRALERRAARSGDPADVAAWHAAHARAGGWFAVVAGTGRVHTWSGRAARAYGVRVLYGALCGQWVAGAPTPAHGTPGCARCAARLRPASPAPR